ncbi:hypothetical protein O3P69_005884 [Scylla paramamosain]|uniref:Uncharacterized protein n=1 Tax=Scylla paramamosain TaxID=85552 RepID=A0AAW0U7G3_SCYPA
MPSPRPAFRHQPADSRIPQSLTSASTPPNEPSLSTSRPIKSGGAGDVTTHEAAITSRNQICGACQRCEPGEKERLVQQQ